MDLAEQAIAELTEISSQVDAAVLFDRGGPVIAATLPDERAGQLASAARSLLEAAEQVRHGELTQLEGATRAGSVFVVRDGERVIAAVTGPEPTAGLVFYDLKSCLRRAAEEPKPKRRTTGTTKNTGSGSP
jgi:predicted regulator of Ras-like GTPase activity (Roadblock/LC7/MglB family)